MYLVVGLGNPGKEYEGTRHNVGFEVIDVLSDKTGIVPNKAKFKGLIGDGNIGGNRVIFLKPQTYMNLSGDSVREVANFYKISNEKIIVVYDDVSIETGRLRIRPSGSDGGQKGMKSIIANLNTSEFPRVRVGIGSPNNDIVNHVLGKYAPCERKKVDEIKKVAADAIIEIIKNGVENSMNRYNSYKACEE